MQKLEAAKEAVVPERFEDVYAAAKRSVLEHNDLDTALRCLKGIAPESQSTWWRWTDLMAALLFWKGEYSACCRILASYDARYPGDPRVAALLQNLRRRCPS